MNTPLQHAERCGRRRPPILRASWRQTPEWWCPDCGRTTPTEPTQSPTRKEDPVTLPTERRRTPITTADLRQATSLLAFWAGVDGKPDYDSYDEALELVPWDQLTVALLISALCETACELAGDREAFRRALDAHALQLATEEGDER